MLKGHDAHEFTVHLVVPSAIQRTKCHPLAETSYPGLFSASRVPATLPSRVINANPFMSKRNPPFSPSQRLPVPVEMIERRIFLIRGHRVMMDSDLAQIYGVSTRRLNEQVRRNRSRFPSDFAFVLTRGEFANLKSHFATSSSRWGVGAESSPMPLQNMGQSWLRMFLTALWQFGPAFRSSAPLCGCEKSWQPTKT